MLQKSSDYDSELGNDKLSKEFDSTISNLEAERSTYYKKTKGLFKRVFFRIVFTISFTSILYGVFINHAEDLVVLIVGTVLLSSIVALIFGGIYTLIRKGTNNYKFSRILKEKLVSKLVAHVNPNLSYLDEGIKKEAFDKADLFPNFKNTSLKSEDTITGTIDGKKVSISECMKNGPAASTRAKTEIKIKGKVISSDRGSLDTNIGEFVTYFDGLFFELEIDGYNFSAPLKFIANRKLPKQVETGISITGHVQSFIKVDKNDKIDLPGEHDYQIFCSDKSQAESKIDDKLLKVADYLFDKYNREGSELLADIPVVGKLPFFKDVKTSKSVFLSFVEGKMYLALEWPRDIFETDVFLKKNLIESGLARHMYEDMLFINQLVSEMNLINKVPEQ
ncbi:MAG TPA: hypothetical protein PKL31_04435 [Fulvivirga sp.]|nr:hypothetical protein [Fulvivirga sp.]